MKLTKLVHSCLLIELNDKKVLVDPGVYSWQNEAVQAFDLSDISAVVVTHNHPDHLNNDFAAAIKQASPQTKWYGTTEAANQLKALGIDCSSTSQDKDIQFIGSAHADLTPWFSEQPEHTSYLIFGDVLVSGDCQTLDSSHGAKVLASAINGGPWGAVVGFTKMIQSMSDRPKTVVPLHDWHWNEAARSAIYERLPEVLGQFDVNFLALENCVSKEI